MGHFFCVLQLCHSSSHAVVFLEYQKPITQTCAQLARVTAAAHRVLAKKPSSTRIPHYTHIYIVFSLYKQQNNSCILSRCLKKGDADVAFICQDRIPGE